MTWLNPCQRCSRWSHWGQSPPRHLLVVAEGRKRAPYSDTTPRATETDREHSLGPPLGWVAGVGCQHALDGGWRVRKHSPALAKVVPDGFAAGKRASAQCHRPRDALCQWEGGLESYLSLQDCKNHKSWRYHLIFKEVPLSLGWPQCPTSSPPDSQKESITTGNPPVPHNLQPEKSQA